MTLKREWFVFFVSPLLLVVVGVGAIQLMSRSRRPRFEEERRGELLVHEVMKVVRSEYVTPTDPMDLAYGAARGMARSLDRYCRVFDRVEIVQQKQKDEGRYKGIGVQAAVLRGRVTILKVVRPGPAARAGLEDGDVVLAIDDHPIPRNPVLSDALRRLKGEPGTTVRLTVRGFHGGEPRNVVVTRGIAENQSVHGDLLDAARGVGYVRIASFRGNTDTQFDKEVERLLAEGLKGLVIDLRGNLGGLLSVAVAITDRFLRSGEIVRTRGRHQVRVMEAHDSRSDLELPVVFLADAESASASEIMIGAMQDLGRAVVVGERTYGKGVVQGDFYFRYGAGGIRLTIAHYLTPAGRCIEKELAIGRGRKRRGGLLPDIPLPLTRLERSHALTLARRRRYQPFIRRALAEEDRTIPPGFKDRQLERAVAVLAGEDHDLRVEIQER